MHEVISAQDYSWTDIITEQNNINQSLEWHDIK